MGKGGGDSSPTRVENFELKNKLNLELETYERICARMDRKSQMLKLLPAVIVTFIVILLVIVIFILIVHS